jgi:hypothetical protein
VLHHTIPLPHNPVYRKTRQKGRNSAQLIEYLVLPGMRALAHRDMAPVDLITQLAQRGDLTHE